MEKLVETYTKYPQTEVWMDSCGKEELEYGVQRGIVGCTSNPVIISGVIKKELDLLKPKYVEFYNETKDVENAAWKLIDYVAGTRAELLKPVFEKEKGLKGRLSVQVNAVDYKNVERMVDKALHLDSLNSNMQIKIPASKEGVEAIEEVTYRGVSVNATVCFTVAQAIAVAEAVERGLKRREAEGKDTSMMNPVCTIMGGRTDDWLKKYLSANEIIKNPEPLEWAGVAVIKHAYKIFNERGYHTKLLVAAFRNHYHWSQFIGGRIVLTIPYKWHKLINKCDIEVKERINDPVKPEYLEVLNTIDEFHKAYDEDGLKPEEFEQYGAFETCIGEFISGYNDFLEYLKTNCL